MKEKFERLKNWIISKKKTVGIALAALLLISGTGVAIAAASMDTGVMERTAEKSTAQKSAKQTTADKKKTDKEGTEETTAEEKETADIQSQQAADDTDSTEKDTATGSQGKSSSGNSVQTSTNSSGSSKSEHIHNWQPQYTTEQKWVVDQAAWTETVSEPVYEMVEKSICNTCGADITGFSVDHILDGNCEGYHSEWVQVLNGTNTYTIPHPEEGHYESYSVQTGYKCSGCGAVK